MHASVARFIPRPGVDPAILATVGAAWALMLGLIALDRADLISHDAVLTGAGEALPLAVVVFLVTWQLMTAAMMLPTSLPMIRAFAVTVRARPRPARAIAAFLAGYFVIWTAFAVLALAGDAVVHWLVDSWAWLAARPWLISGGILVAAGAFQFSPIKERCLAECRSPVQFLWRHYRPGIGNAWLLGLRHGVFCLGCCWALMLAMFAVGVGSVIWMVALTGVMLVEKTSRYGRRLVPIVGAVFIAWGFLVLLQPSAVAAHAGEVHVPQANPDPVLGAAIIGTSIAILLARRLLSRRGRTRQSSADATSGGNDPAR
jgi:predicted metal-binding membrane protein